MRVSGQKSSLTDPPTDLKDAIDWLALVGGGYGGKVENGWSSGKFREFDSKIHDLPGWTEAKQKSGIDFFQGVIKEVAANRLSQFLGYISTQTIGGDSGIIKGDGHYESKYKDFEWKEGQEKDYLKVTLFAAAMAFLGLSYMYLKCSISYGWAGESLNRAGALKNYVTWMGYGSNYLNRNKYGRDIAQLLEDRFGNKFDGLASPEEWSPYSTFLQNLETKYSSQRIAVNHPLTACYIAAKEYFTSQLKDSDPADETLRAIKANIETFKTSCGLSDHDLKEQIGTLLPNNTVSGYSATSHAPPEQPSPAGPVAGTLSTFGLGGGAAAAYLLDIGGAKTLVNGLLRIGVIVLLTCALYCACVTFRYYFIHPLSTSLTNSPSNLKEAIGWILRVTGKDGQGSDNTAALAKAVKGLLQSAVTEIESFPKKLHVNGPEFGKLKQELTKAVTWVEKDDKLSDGCKRHSDLKASHNKNHLDNVNKALKELYGKYGKGPGGLKRLAQDKCGLADFVGSSVGQFVKQLGNAFDTQFNTLNGVNDSAQTVAEKVGDYLKTVLNSWVQGGSNGVDTQLKGNHFQHPLLKKILDAGKNAFMDKLKRANYTPTNYETNVQSASIKEVHARIFLGCLPLYSQALTYIYWGCHDKGGGWGSQTLANGSMRSYFDSQGLLPLYVDKNKRGAQIAKSALGGFSEFGAAASSSLSSAHSPYVSFTAELQKKVGQNTSNYPLSALYHGASCYFQCQQVTNAKSAAGAPKTIREMLYFLAALQFSSAYDEIDGYIGTVLNPSMNVADSSKPASGGNDTLSSDQLKEYLRASCAFSSSVLGLIQGPGASQNASDPWLFELFCNSAFQFKYPSGAALFSTVSSYAYALQFQLLFLYYMCANNVNKCGWQDCIFGKGMKPNGSEGTVPSHMCPGLTCGGKPDCKHDGTNNGCKHSFHANNNKEPTCGKATNSPLQAFLTDCINGLCRSHPTNSTSYLSTCSGSLCHVPMGFQATHLRQNAANGARVYLVLKSICGGSDTPLRQLCEKLGCLTKRTPRSLGDLFGFMWHLNGHLSRTLTNITNAEWLKNLADLTPFSSTVKDHINVLESFVGSGHSNTHPDLVSLTNSTCNQQQQTCGPYLSPLSLSNGATFGKTAPYASTYLSWMFYLTDDLQSGFQEFLDEFKNIDCSNMGCRGKGGSQQACQLQHPGTHGSDQSCQCDSVVHCGGVLPLLYRYGFTFSDMGALFGEGNTNTKRTCANFHTQLQSVISGNPLSSLLTSIDDFLFLFRYYFLGNLSAFWTIYIGLILYTFFFLLDTLHLRSHLKLASSHVLPPLALLTSGKPLPITKLKYITQ
ncbi:uncharacterized protein BcabD6B2_19990 [Babesia caballi]|uniref:Variant erythrocyte surface antigen-1, beta subunit n=1 Tax=Babesia caballi TaxID=5871 RepID=A0AAV4LVI3_BABCB|nr:hypothetical protein, conserved [Babesia caballi]